MPVAFVMGAAGAIGKQCVTELRLRGWSVAGLGHGSVAWNAPFGIDFWLAGDIVAKNLDLLGERVGTPDLIINLAGGSSVNPSLQAPLGDFERTVGAGMCILNWAWKNAPNANLSFASSAAVYGTGHDEPISEIASLSPLSPYGHHKMMMEMNAHFWARSFGIKSAVVRLFSVYGTGLRKQFVYDLLTKLEKSPKEIILSGTGGEIRDWIWIRDAAKMMIDIGALATVDVPVFNGCTGIGTCISDVAFQLLELWGSDTKIRFDGISRLGDPIHLYGDATSLDIHGMRPQVSLKEGLTKIVVDWRRVLFA